MIHASHFPESMQQIVQAIGIDSALALARTYGGSKVWIPTADKLAEVHPVAQLLGMDQALALARIVGGSRLQVPLCQSVNDAIRNAQIVERWQAGDTARQISRTFNMTERGVMYVLEHARVRS